MTVDSVRQKQTSSGQNRELPKPSGRLLKRFTAQVWLSTGLVFVLALMVSGFIVTIVEQNRLQSGRQMATELAAAIADGLNERLGRSLSATYALAAVIRQGQGEVENFEQLASDMLNLYGGINSLQLLPNGIIQQIMPLAGNEKAIGHNLLEDTRRNREVLLAMQTRALTLAGPFELIQGGVAVIGRLPVYLPKETGEQLWGFTAALIRISDLLREINLQRVEEKGYRYELSRINPDSGQRQVFASSGAATIAPVTHSIEVPNGTWQFALEPANGWYSARALVCEVLLSLLFSLLAAAAVYRTVRQPLLLQQLVEERTRQLSATNEQLLTEIERRTRADQEQQAAKQALAESEQRYRTVIEQMQDVVYQADAQGRLTMLSPSGADLLGYAGADGMLGADIKSTFYFDPAERDRFLAVLRSSGFVSSYPITLKRQDGTPVQVSTSTHLLFDENGEYCGVEGLFRDITAQVAAQQALRASEAKFQSAFEHAPLLMTISVPETGQYLAVNREFCRVSGFTADEVIGRTSVELGWLSAAERERVVREFTEQGRVKSLDLVLTAKDGRTIYCDFRAELVTFNGEQRLLSIALDVTEQRLAKLALMQSEERYRELVEQSAAWLWETDATIRHIYSNGRVESMLGYPVKEFLTMDIFALLHPEDHEIVRAIVDRAVNDRQGWRECILRWKHHDGSWRFIQSSGMPHYDENGVFAGLHGVDIDVTDRMRLQEEQDRNQRLESLGLLAGGIAHDFNNILTGIVGNISLARMLIDTDSKAQERLQKSEQACKRAVNLTRQLLTFARGGEPVKQKTDVVRLLHESAEFSLRGSGISFDLAQPPEPWTVEADEGQLTQVFNNLLLNAAHSMPGGGQISLRVFNCQLGQEESILTRAGDFVRITISDQGSGIPPEHLSKIFDPYFTTKSHGTGLGLTSAYSIVKKHGGQLSVSSEVGKGSCFEILLPADPGSAPEAVPAAVPGFQAGNGRILVMDDEESLREVLLEMLTALGYAPVSCSSGSEAICRYQEALARGDRFTAVILDLTVPGGMGGKEAAEQLRTMDQAVVLIAASGYSNDPVMADFRAFGFDGTVAKPFQVPQLAEALHRAIAGTGSAKTEE
jgi:PAS domain S-box-containing protein